MKLFDVEFAAVCEALEALAEGEAMPDIVRVWAEKAGIKPAEALRRYKKAGEIVREQYPKVEPESDQWYRIKVGVFKGMMGFKPAPVPPQPTAPAGGKDAAKDPPDSRDAATKDGEKKPKKDEPKKGDDDRVRVSVTVGGKKQESLGDQFAKVQESTQMNETVFQVLDLLSQTEGFIEAAQIQEALGLPRRAQAMAVLTRMTADGLLRYERGRGYGLSEGEEVDALIARAARTAGAVGDRVERLGPVDEGRLTPQAAAKKLRLAADAYIEHLKKALKLDAEDERAYEKDRTALYTVADLIERGQFKQAWKAWNRLDTAVRDVVPDAVLDLIDPNPDESVEEGSATANRLADYIARRNPDADDLAREFRISRASASWILTKVIEHGSDQHAVLREIRRALGEAVDEVKNVPYDAKLWIKKGLPRLSSSDYKVVLGAQAALQKKYGKGMKMSHRRKVAHDGGGLDISDEIFDALRTAGAGASDLDRLQQYLINALHGAQAESVDEVAATTGHKRAPNFRDAKPSEMRRDEVCSACEHFNADSDACGKYRFIVPDPHGEVCDSFERWVDESLDEARIRVECDECENRFKVDAGASSKTYKCPECGSTQGFTRLGYAESIDEGKAVPKIDSDVYTRKQKWPKYNVQVSPLAAHGSDAGKMLAQRLPGWTKADHLAAAAHHEKQAKKLEKEWGETAEKAAQATWGRSYQMTDYRISGVASDEFADEFKDKLRHAAHTKTEHKDAAAAHTAAARMRSLAKESVEEARMGEPDDATKARLQKGAAAFHQRGSDRQQARLGHVQLKPTSTSTEPGDILNRSNPKMLGKEGDEYDVRYKGKSLGTIRFSGSVWSSTDARGKNVVSKEGWSLRNAVLQVLGRALGDAWGSADESLLPSTIDAYERVIAEGGLSHGAFATLIDDAPSDLTVEDDHGVEWTVRQDRWYPDVAEAKKAAGYWRTTKSGHRVYIEGGKITKGNPHVLKATRRDESLDEAIPKSTTYCLVDKETKKVLQVGSKSTITKARKAHEDPSSVVVYVSPGRKVGDVIGESVDEARENKPGVPSINQAGPDEFIISYRKGQSMGSGHLWWTGPDGRSKWSDARVDAKVFKSRKEAQSDLRAAKKAVHPSNVPSESTEYRSQQRFTEPELRGAYEVWKQPTYAVTFEEWLARHFEPIDEGYVLDVPFETKEVDFLTVMRALAKPASLVEAAAEPTVIATEVLRITTRPKNPDYSVPAPGSEYRNFALYDDGTIVREEWVDGRNQRTLVGNVGAEGTADFIDSLRAMVMDYAEPLSGRVADVTAVVTESLDEAGDAELYVARKDVTVHHPGGSSSVVKKGSRVRLIASARAGYYIGGPDSTHNTLDRRVETADFREGFRRVSEGVTDEALTPKSLKVGRFYEVHTSTSSTEPDHVLFVTGFQANGTAKGVAYDVARNKPAKASFNGFNLSRAAEVAMSEVDARAKAQIARKLDGQSFEDFTEDLDEGVRAFKFKDHMGNTFTMYLNGKHGPLFANQERVPYSPATFSPSYEAGYNVQRKEVLDWAKGLEKLSDADVRKAMRKFLSGYKMVEDADESDLDEGYQHVHWKGSKSLRFKLATANGKGKSVQGRTFGGSIGVHADNKLQHWVVTHIPTGRRIATTTRDEDAVKVAKSLEGNSALDLSFTDMADATPETMAAIKAAAARLRESVEEGLTYSPAIKRVEKVLRAHNLSTLADDLVRASRDGDRTDARLIAGQIKEVAQRIGGMTKLLKARDVLLQELEDTLVDSVEEAQLDEVDPVTMIGAIGAVAVGAGLSAAAIRLIRAARAALSVGKTDVADAMLDKLSASDRRALQAIYKGGLGVKETTTSATTGGFRAGGRPRHATPEDLGVDDEDEDDEEVDEAVWQVWPKGSIASKSNPDYLIVHAKSLKEATQIAGQKRPEFDSKTWNVVRLGEAVEESDDPEDATAFAQGGPGGGPPLNGPALTKKDRPVNKGQDGAIRDVQGSEKVESVALPREALQRFAELARTLGLPGSTVLTPTAEGFTVDLPADVAQKVREELELETAA